MNGIGSARSVHLAWNDAEHAISYEVQQWDGRAGQWRTLPFRESHLAYSYTITLNPVIESRAVVGRLNNHWC